MLAIQRSIASEITSLPLLPTVAKPNSMIKALKLTNQACKFEYVVHLTRLSSTVGETEAFNETFVARITLSNMFSFTLPFEDFTPYSSLNMIMSVLCSM